MRQIYHHYETWEEFHAGMWRIVTSEEARQFCERAIVFTGDAVLYGSYMQRVIREWPISCEQNLSNVSMNRRAWIGHAACCLAISCPEYATRQAWKQLSPQQQDDANAQADMAILAWENLHERENTCLGQEVGRQGVFEWHS